MVQTPAPAPYVDAFHSPNQQKLGIVKMDALTHVLSISRAQLRKDGRMEARNKVLDPGFVNRVIGAMNDTITLCVARLEVNDNDYNDLNHISDIRRFNPRLVLKSFMQAAYPRDFPEEQTSISCNLVARYEAFLEHVLITDVVENLSSLFCIRFLNAIAAHIRVFGEDRPETLEEKKESTLERLRLTLSFLQQPNLRPFIRANTQRKLHSIMLIINTHGWNAEANEILFN